MQSECGIITSGGAAVPGYQRPEGVLACRKGLYDPAYEHDSCGIGFVADIKGRASHEILARALEVLERMCHRGAESADNKTGDGAGVLIQMPHAFYKAEVPALPDAGSYAAGLLFLPRDGALQAEVIAKAKELTAASGLSIIALRDVPTDSSCLGAISKSAEPVVKMVFAGIANRESGTASRLPILCYLFRRRLEKWAEERAAADGRFADVYMPSFNARTIVYKGMLMPAQLAAYYADLRDERLQTAVAQVHSRFSTNTFPAWRLAQPFRFISHNGEINTVRGNRLWAAAREALYESPVFGAALPDILPLLQEGASDSASFDNMLELLVLAGRSLPQALMMLIPEAWNDKNPIPDELKAFYEYSACLMEPWDGPASLVFCDGRYVGGTLDRNGLRPSRYTITKNGLIVMASETGVQDFRPEEIERKGRLLPGKLLFVDLEEGRIIPDAEIKQNVARAKPYQQWVKNNVVTLEQSDALDSPFPVPDSPYTELLHGYTREDRNNLLLPMAATAAEPTSSMGTDTPLAVFSRIPQRVFAYFKQMFAQVTNPPIDSIREDLVMTLTSFVGPQRNLLAETEAHCRRVKVLEPVLTPSELERLLSLAPAEFTSRRLDMVFANRESAPDSLEQALDALAARAIEAVRSGVSLLILSDLAACDPESGLVPVPSLLACGAVHHALIRAGLRMKSSIIVESAEPREVMHFALLFGFGADLIIPYGAYASIAAIAASPDAARLGEQPLANYRKAIHKALLKIMSKMGTSTLRSYRGAEIFESIGLSAAVTEKCFHGVTNRTGGASFDDLEQEAIARWRQAQAVYRETGNGNQSRSNCVSDTSDSPLLPGDGQYRWRKNGERHAWNPETIYLLQWAVRSGDYAKFKQFTAAADAVTLTPHLLRGLLEFKVGNGGVERNAQTIRAAEQSPGSTTDLRSSPPLPIEEVEPVEAIIPRFTTGAMSFGSISKEVHETIAQAMNSLQARSNSGEGGEDNERYVRRADGSWTRSQIKQVASGRFGVTSEYLANCIEIQIKMAQGAKPGEGGQLPGHKVDVMVGKTRYATPGVTLISPPPHHDIYSIEDLAELIFDLKNANPEARINVKLVSESGVGTIAAGVAKAHADNILISGYDGGTGASPQSSIRHAGLPWELGLSETHQTLVRNGLRGRVRLQTDGQLKTGRDIVIAGLLGAEEFGFGTATLITQGCVMMRKCHENNCPAGIATQDPELRKRFHGKPEYLVNFFRFLAEEVREIMASLGFRHFDDLVGRSDLLVQKKGEGKAAGLDLSPILYRESGPDYISGGQETHCTQNQIHAISEVLDRRLIEKCRPALENRQPVAFSLPVKNTDRATGAMLSYEVSKRFGERGLPDNFITIDFTGSAGQSFGAFLAPGITFRLAGDTNDYLGKGLSGGRIAIAPPPGSTFRTEENIIVGNTVLYGATSGSLYVAGVAGERFCVRNSGAQAVVEGAGDHCAEYMTGGRLVVLGDVGRNFAAGMSGGIAYVLDRRGNFEYYLNRGMVELSGLDTSEDETFVKNVIRSHVYWTGSAYAQRILDNWQDERALFIKILPVEYKRALQQQKLAELDRKLYDIREREEIGEKG